MKTRGELSWNSVLFLEKWELIRRSYREHVRPHNLFICSSTPDRGEAEERVRGLTAFASSLTSVVGTAWSSFSWRDLRTYRWVLLGVGAHILSVRAVGCATRLSYERGFVDADRIDVWQNVLRKDGRLWASLGLCWRYHQALRFIDSALDKAETEHHTRGLLLAGKADCFYMLGRRDFTGPVYGLSRQAQSIAVDISGTEPGQAVRIFRGVGILYFKLGHFSDAEAAFFQAIKILSREGGLDDQWGKLEKALSECGMMGLLTA